MEELDALTKELHDLRTRLDRSDAFVDALLDGLPLHVKLIYCPHNDDDAADKTPLHLMCEHGFGKDDGLFAQLVRLNGETNERDSRGRTPLMLACRNGHQGCVQVLLNWSVSTDLELQSDEGDAGHLTALHQAIAAGHVGCVQTLLHHGASITGREDDDGYTALHFACSEGQPASVAALLEHKADPKAVTTDGCTALHFACARGSVDCLSTLLTAGANASATDAFSQTGLHGMSSPWYADYGTFVDRAACARRLMIAGANVNALDASGDTPVKAACLVGNFVLARTLLEGGAGPCEEDPRRETLASNVHTWSGGAHSTSCDVLRLASYARCDSLLQRATLLGEASQVVGGLDWTPATHHLLADCDRAVVEAAWRALLLVARRRPALTLPRDALFKVLAVVATCERD